MPTLRKPQPTDFLPNFAGFVIGDSLHHLLYLLPLARRTLTRAVIVLGATAKFRKDMTATSPEINFIFLPGKLKPEAVARACSLYDALLFSNAYKYFEEKIRSHISPHVVLTRLAHGPLSKFSVEPAYIRKNLSAWDALVVAGPRDAFLTLKALNAPNPEIALSKQVVSLSKNKQPDLLLIQSGNLRHQDFAARRPPVSRAPQSEKIRVLSMSTYTPFKGKDSLEMLATLIAETDFCHHFDIKFSLHPNLLDQPERLALLEKACTKAGLDFNEKKQVGEYLPLMENADAVLADNTSGSIDFLMFDRPLMFLDVTGEYTAKEEIAWDDPCWMFRHGEHINPAMLASGTMAALAQRLREERKATARQESRDYAFGKSTGAGKTLRAIANHWKLKESVPGPR